MHIFDEMHLFTEIMHFFAEAMHIFAEIIIYIFAEIMHVFAEIIHTLMIYIILAQAPEASRDNPCLSSVRLRVLFYCHVAISDACRGGCPRRLVE